MLFVYTLYLFIHYKQKKIFLYIIKIIFYNVYEYNQVVSLLNSNFSLLLLQEKCPIKDLGNEWGFLLFNHLVHPPHQVEELMHI